MYILNIGLFYYVLCTVGAKYNKILSWCEWSWVHFTLLSDLFVKALVELCWKYFWYYTTEYQIHNSQEHEKSRRLLQVVKVKFICTAQCQMQRQSVLTFLITPWPFSQTDLSPGNRVNSARVHTPKNRFFCFCFNLNILRNSAMKMFD